MMAIMFAKSKKPETPESAFRKACIQWLKIRFGRHLWHFRTRAGIGQRYGVLDDHFIIRGIAVQAEFKRPDGKFRTDTKQYRAQTKEIENVINAGGRAAFVDSWGALENLVSGIEPVQPSAMSRIK